MVKFAALLFHKEVVICNISVQMRKYIIGEPGQYFKMAISQFDKTYMKFIISAIIQSLRFIFHGVPFIIFQKKLLAYQTGKKCLLHFSAQS